MTPKDVRQVPDFWLNLISRTILDRASYESHFVNDRKKLTRGTLVVIARDKTCNTYIVQDTSGFRVMEVFVIVLELISWRPRK